MFIKELQGRNVIVRCDFNIPSDVEDLTRIYAVKDTISELLKLGCNIILMSHYKRPKPTEVFDSKFSLKQIIPSIERVLGLHINFLPQNVMHIKRSDIESGVYLLENLRFYPEERENNEIFAKHLASLADAYVNEAFSVAHRAHASIVAITKFLPSYAGISFMKEISHLKSVTQNIERPYTAIIGGSKVSSKIEVLDAIAKLADTLIITGAMANTFLAAQGYDMKRSLIESDFLDKANIILRHATAKIILPRDFMCSTSIDINGKCYRLKCIPNDYSCFDIGERSINTIKMELSKSKTVLWNGAVGAFEFSNFNVGSKEIAEFLADLTRKNRIKSVIGGGETVASIGNLKNDMTFVSTAGGAFLEFIAGSTLPGVAALGL